MKHRVAPRARALSMFALAAILLSTSLPAFAQEVYGSLTGKVADAQGGVVRGANVELANEQRTLTATTDDEGGFQFLNVLPGTYRMTVAAAGFRTATRDSVPVELGRTFQVNFDLAAGLASETVEVSASDEPIVDVTSTKTATNVTKEEYDVIPKTLNFASILNVAPGTREEARGQGIQVDGASTAENVFILDGVEVTRIRDGKLAPNNNVPYDFVQEVQIKSAGFEAEYGGATGGVINVATRSGGNEFHGEARFEFQFDELRAEDNPLLRLSAVDDSQFEYFRNPTGKDDTRLFAPTFSLSGPIYKDRVWFYASYAPQYFRTTRELDLIDVTATGINTLDRRDIDYRTKYDYSFGRIDWAPSDKFQANVGFIGSPLAQEGPYVGGGGFSNEAVNFLNQQTDSVTAFSNPRYEFQGGYSPSWQVAGAATWNPLSSLVLSFRGGHTYLNSKTGSYDAPLGQPLVNIINPCDPGQFDCAPGTTVFNSQPEIVSNFATLFNITRRTNLNFDATYVARYFDQQHIIKGGYQINRLSNKVDEGNQGGIINFYFDTAYTPTAGPFAGDPQRGEFGYYRVTDFGTKGDVSSKNQALFIQDASTVHPRVTINAGIRFENEFLPTFPIDTTFHPTVDPELLASAPQRPIEFGWGDKIAPRLGAAWDVMGDGKLKVYGSFGFFFDTMKYELPRGSFGGDRFLRSYYRLDQADYRGITLGNTPGGLIQGPIDFRVPSSINFPGARPTIDPDLKATRSREYTVGADYAVSTNLLAAVRLTRKELDRTIEDIGGLDAGGNEVYTIGNPGFGASVDFFDPPTPKAVREYTGLEFRLDRRFANNWYANISYIYSKLFGNYSGLASTDEIDINGLGRSSPNVNRYFDLPELSYDAYGNPVYGRLTTDRPHVFKAFASYRFNTFLGQTDIGGTQLAYSGTPISTRIRVQNADFLAEGRGDLGRTEAFTQTDMLVNHRFQINERVAIKGSFNVLNLFDERNVVNVYEFTLKPGQNVGYDSLQDFLTQNGDYRQRIIDQGLDLDPQFLQPRNFQAPREARFSFGVEF